MARGPAHRARYCPRRCLRQMPTPWPPLAPRAASPAAPPRIRPWHYRRDRCAGLLCAAVLSHPRLRAEYDAASEYDVKALALEARLPSPTQHALPC